VLCAVFLVVAVGLRPIRIQAAQADIALATAEQVAEDAYLLARAESVPVRATRHWQRPPSEPPTGLVGFSGARRIQLPFEGGYLREQALQLDRVAVVVQTGGATWSTCLTLTSVAFSVIEPVVGEPQLVSSFDLMELDGDAARLAELAPECPDT
jgi:hypothetical protein